MSWLQLRLPATPAAPAVTPAAAPAADPETQESKFCKLHFYDNVNAPNKLDHTLALIELNARMSNCFNVDWTLYCDEDAKTSGTLYFKVTDNNDGTLPTFSVFINRFKNNMLLLTFTDFTGAHLVPTVSNVFLNRRKPDVSSQLGGSPYVSWPPTNSLLDNPFPMPSTPAKKPEPEIQPIPASLFGSSVGSWPFATPQEFSLGTWPESLSSIDEKPQGSSGSTIGSWPESFSSTLGSSPFDTKEFSKENEGYEFWNRNWTKLNEPKVTFNFDSLKNDSLFKEKHGKDAKWGDVYGKTECENECENEDESESECYCHEPENLENSYDGCECGCWEDCTCACHSNTGDCDYNCGCALESSDEEMLDEAPSIDDVSSDETEIQYYGCCEGCNKLCKLEEEETSSLDDEMPSLEEASSDELECCCKECKHECDECDESTEDESTEGKPDTEEFNKKIDRLLQDLDELRIGTGILKSTPPPSSPPYPPPCPDINVKPCVNRYLLGTTSFNEELLKKRDEILNKSLKKIQIKLNYSNRLRELYNALIFKY